MEVISHKAGWKINQDEEGKDSQVHTHLMWCHKIDGGKRNFSELLKREKFRNFFSLKHTHASTNIW